MLNHFILTIYFWASHGFWQIKTITSASFKMISKDLHRIWNHWLHSTCEDRLKLDKKFDLNRVQSPTLRSAATLCQSSELDAPLQLQAVNFFVIQFQTEQPVAASLATRVHTCDCACISDWVVCHLKGSRSAIQNHAQFWRINFWQVQFEVGCKQLHF